MNLYDSYIDAGQEMNERERKDFYCALIEYTAYGCSPENLRGAAKATWIAILPSLELSKTRSEAGKNGGSSTKQKRNLLHSKTSSKHGANSESNGEAKNKNKNKTTNTDVLVVREKAFKPPSKADVSAYAAERGHPSFNAEMFCDFYQSKGWLVGRTKMKDWKAAVRNWLKTDGGGNGIQDGSSW